MNQTENYFKRILVHDLEQEEFRKQFPAIDEDTIVLSNNKAIVQCIGCFGCWIKTPGTCAMKDGYENHGKNLCHAEEFIVISKCTYGGFSPFVKNVLDRSIPSMLPFFSIRKNEMHHTSRVKNQSRLKVYFYSDDITDEEKQTAMELVKANEVNFNVLKSEIYFYQSCLEIMEKHI